MSNWSQIGDVILSLGLGEGVPARRGPEAKAAYARMLRENQTRAERHMATVLACFGIDAQPQVPILGWIADFYDPLTRTVIEVDGSSHDNRQGQDDLRDERMRAAGYRVYRFRNEEVSHFLQNIALDRWPT